MRWPPERSPPRLTVAGFATRGRRSARIGFRPPLVGGATGSGAAAGSGEAGAFLGPGAPGAGVRLDRTSASRSRRKTTSVSALAARSLASASCWPASCRFPSWISILFHASTGTIIVSVEAGASAGSAVVAGAGSGRGSTGAVDIGLPSASARSRTAARSTIRSVSSPSDSRYEGTASRRAHLRRVLTGIPVAAWASCRVTQGASSSIGRGAMSRRCDTPGGDDRLGLSRSAAVSHRVVRFTAPGYRTIERGRGSRPP